MGQTAQISEQPDIVATSWSCIVRYMAYSSNDTKKTEGMVPQIVPRAALPGASLSSEAAIVLTKVGTSAESLRRCFKAEDSGRHIST